MIIRENDAENKIYLHYAGGIMAFDVINNHDIELVWPRAPFTNMV